MYEYKLERSRESLFFNVLPSMAPLSHGKRALAQLSHDTCRDQDTDKRNELYLDERVEFRGSL
jgi:hypothetical protein